MKENLKKSYKNEEDIDFIGILKNIWDHRVLVTKIILTFFIIGCIMAITSPVVYTSQTTFVPQVSDDQMSTAKNELGSLASLAGINLNSNSKSIDKYISPLLYPKIAESEEFSLKLLEEEIINLNGEKFTIKEYMLSQKSKFNFNPIVFIKKYTIDLFKKVDNEITSSNISKNYNFINKEDFKLINEFKGKFTIVLNDTEGYIKISATEKDAFISTQFVDKITKNLQSKIIELRTNKIRERLEYSKKQYQLKQKEFDLLQKELAEFKDSNKNISTASFMSKLQKLETEYQLQKSILINLASEFNNNKIKLNKNTPIFSVIDEVSVPNLRSAPKRSQIVIISTFLGFIFSIFFILIKDPFLELIKKIIK